MNEAPQHRGKILDAGLARSVSEGDETPTIVLVEVAAPYAQVALRRSSKSGRTAFVPAAAPSPTPAQASETDGGRRRVEALLAQLSGDPPQWIAAARAFVASVAPARLGLLVESDDVRSIAPSGEHRVV